MQTEFAPRKRQTLRVSSAAFEPNGPIPMKYTCEGQDLCPALAWDKPPPGTQSIAILVDDPDAPDPAAPRRTWTHWILTGIPGHVTALPGTGDLPAGAVVGTNDWGKRRWQGPCPPIGRHRYSFKVYALDIVLRAPGISRLELLGSIRDHVLAQGELIGTYQKLRS